ncbi:Coenzyme F420 hydrogenase/dehydrogenase, beta subunit C-terminal domain [Actibacterium lipolyticum]|uniref:Coenzyme F420-reducing hydrogenase subunit beta n=1 Tax=Actibacterium lipolyticum TaxID=1524263 RepID=A0A238KUR1_9RHOB|nr:Coenzyme F420 hydrogenase/dehydrogenase, beta subunit C-terminal domain [Actibacterium lipolyticum]SMX46437.1 coenzyme F420-reducing hydrogenase subunit beta [Actibacterium lipolyticum]
MSDFSSANLSKVQRGDLCAGCGACAAIAPGKVSMRIAKSGYLRPDQSADLSPQEEARVGQACPGLGETVTVDGRKTDTLWGPYVAMRQGNALNPALRFQASSGGGLSAVLVHLLESGKVDGVVQTAAAPDLPIGNCTVLSQTPEDVFNAAGSRYAPSDPVTAIYQTIVPGKRYAFVGKPCDIVAMRGLMKDDAELKAAVPYLLSFFCAGVPSLKGVEEVLGALGTTLDDTAAFRFRGQGWPGHATATDRAGTERSMTYHDSWGKVLSRHVQHRCKVCADGTGKLADLVFADAWESDEAGYPVFEERDGTSLIVARTDAGQALLNAAEAAGSIESEPFDVATLAAIQPGQRGRRRALFARLAGLKLCLKPIPNYRGLTLVAAARQNPLKENMRNFLGMVRRVLTGRIGS